MIFVPFFVPGTTQYRIAELRLNHYFRQLASTYEVIYYRYPVWQPGEKIKVKCRQRLGVNDYEFGRR